MTEGTPEAVPASAIGAAAEIASKDTAAAAAAAATEAAAKAAAEAGKTVEVADGKTDEAKTGAPETYQTFTLKEGLEIDQPAMDKFIPIAKDLNLTQEQAQKLVDLQSELAQQSAAADQAAWDSTLTGWVTNAKADKEIGGAGFNDAIAHAGKAIATFGTAELKAALDATGVGNHPEFIRVFARIGKAISEDKLHFGNAEAGTRELSLAERLFPNQGKPQGA